MKSITIILMGLICSNAHAAEGSKVCKANAEKYVKTFSAVTFRILKEGKATTAQARFIQASNVSNGTEEVYEVESTGNSADPLHCTYRVEMLKNITNNCWAKSIAETECGG